MTFHAPAAEKTRSAVMMAGLVSLVLAATAAPLLAQEAKRSLEPVTGDVYRFQNNFHNAMVVVTDEGIVGLGPQAADVQLRQMHVGPSSRSAIGRPSRTPAHW